MYGHSFQVQGILLVLSQNSRCLVAALPEQLLLGKNLENVRKLWKRFGLMQHESAEKNIQNISGSLQRSFTPFNAQPSGWAYFVIGMLEGVSMKNSSKGRQTPSMDRPPFRWLRSRAAAALASPWPCDGLRTTSPNAKTAYGGSTVPMLCLVLALTGPLSNAFPNNLSWSMTFTSRERTTLNSFNG